MHLRVNLTDQILHFNNKSQGENNEIMINAEILEILRVS